MESLIWKKRGNTRTAYVRHKYIIISGQVGPVDARSRDLERTKVSAHGLDGAGLSDGCKKTWMRKKQRRYITDEFYVALMYISTDRKGTQDSSRQVRDGNETMKRNDETRRTRVVE